jgi:geranylgeranyl pyrophosphate synthase
LSTTTSFFTPVQEQIHQVEDLMRAQAVNHHHDLQAALDHLLSSGGKRIRPTVTLLVGRMLGADDNRLITLAASIELLHTATLVHDDLIDGSILRRGIPTLNSRWSPGATVLTGDFLFARAAKLASDTDSIPVMNLFSKTLSTIVNGEITQLFSSRCQVNRQEYFQRIYAKTASLFEAAVSCAALISNGSQETIDTVRHFGYNIGMAFQIVDDIFDFTGDQSKLGKPVGNDLRQGLITLPAIYYIEQNPDDNSAQDILAGNCFQYGQELSLLIERISASNAIESSLIEADGYIQTAMSCLEKFSTSPEQMHLKELTLYITRRNV